MVPVASSQSELYLYLWGAIAFVKAYPTTTFVIVLLLCSITFTLIGPKLLGDVAHAEDEEEEFWECK